MAKYAEGTYETDDSFLVLTRDGGKVIPKKPFNARDHFDCTPQQYHGGLDQLWAALGIESVQDEDVFTLAARAIKRGDHLARILQCQYAHGQLKNVVLYPCHCGRLTVDEWYLGHVEGYHKERSVVEVANVDEARAIYQSILGTLRESHYIPETDTYTRRGQNDNFIVTGSHCRCKEHLA